MRLSCAGLALLTVVAVAACGGSGSSTVDNASGSGGGSPSGSTGSTTTVTRTAIVPGATANPTASGTTGPGGSGGSGGAGLTTSGSGAAAGGPPCTAAALELSFLGGQGATGHGELGFALRNTGSASCTTVGYPGIQFLGRSGAALATDPTHTTSDFFGQTVLRMLTVAPGQSVSFRLGVTHDGSACATAYGLQVIAPNDTATLHVDLGGGVSECGTATVSPVQPGDSAYSSN